MKILVTGLIFATLALAACGKTEAEQGHDNINNVESQRQILESQYQISVADHEQTLHWLSSDLTADQLRGARSHLEILVANAHDAVRHGHGEDVKEIGDVDAGMIGRAADAQVWISEIDGRLKNINSISK